MDECDNSQPGSGEVQANTDGPAPIPALSRAEHSAGAVLVARIDREYRALLIRIRAGAFELPKGHVEAGESKTAAALREIQEETNVTGPLSIVGQIGVVTYEFVSKEGQVRKEVTYFVAVPGGDGPPSVGPRPRRTRELKWVTESEIQEVPLVNPELATIVLNALHRVKSVL